MPEQTLCGAAFGKSQLRRRKIAPPCIGGDEPRLCLHGHDGGNANRR